MFLNLNITTMKKFIMAAALLVGSFSCSFAQHEVGSWAVQPKAGINIANMTKSEGSAKVGFIAGAEVEYQATSLVSVSLGALYSQQGTKGSDDEMSEQIKMDYINIPVLANVYVAKGLAVKLGLQPGFKVSAKAKTTGEGVSATVDLEKVFEAAKVESYSIPSFCLSLPVGLSYEYKNVVLDARYNLGLTKALEVEKDKSRHNFFQLTLGYKFAL